MTTITSNAYNFSDYINSGVDTRTGMYSLSISLGNYVSHKGAGLSLPIAISYSSSSQFDSGFGRGWGMPISRFNKDNNSLSLSTGQSFEIKWNSVASEYDIPSRKLLDIRVFYVGETQEIKVVYKDGRHEYLSWDDGLLKRTVSPQGLEIYYEYSRLNNEQILWRLGDTPTSGSGHEIIINWWSDDWNANVEYYIEGTLYKSILFRKVSGGSHKRLSYATLPEGMRLSLEYTYAESTGYDLINKVTHASGLIEEITYLHSGHSTPGGAPLASVPYVTRYKVTPGNNQPSSYTIYQYSDTNYLGAHSSQGWVANKDTLFEVRSNYKYTTTETINGEKKIVTTFNKYHLKDSELFYFNDVLKREEHYSYFADLNKSIDFQPATYSLLREKNTVINSNGQSKVFTTSYGYDDSANETYKKEPDGTEYDVTYYPAEGDIDCPAAPDNMVAFVKKQTINPPFNADGSRDQARIEAYSYISLPKLNDNSYFVLVDEIKMGLESDIWTKSKTTYFDVPINSLSYGQPSTETATYNGYTQTQQFFYSCTGNQCSIITKFITHAGLSLTSESVVSSLTGSTIQQTDENGITNLTEYDLAERVIKQVMSLGTANETTTQYTYNIVANDCWMSETGPTGIVLKNTLNNAGLSIREEIKDSSGIYQPFTEYSYDVYGQVIEQVDIDLLSGVELQTTTRSEYDEMGQLKRVIHPDLREELYDNDLINLTSTYQLKGLLKVVTVSDLIGNELLKESYDANNNLLIQTANIYDGYSNLISTTDIKGRVTHFVYDRLDRVVTIEKRIDGELVTENYEYCDFSTEALATKVSVNQVNLGIQQYDSLLRMSSRTLTGGGTESYQYNGVPFLPSQVNTANNQQINFGYNTQLQMPKSADVVGDASLSIGYQYDQEGNVTSTTSLNEKSNYTYNAQGQLVAKSVIINGISREATYTFSLRGKMLSSVDFFGNRTDFSYDKHGRPVSSTTHALSGTTVSSQEYDAFSRVINTVERCGADEMITNLTLSSLGLELAREVIFNGQVQCRFEQDYTDSIQISNRRFYKDNQLTTEQFSYDAFDRLVHYRVTGANAPRDEFTNVLASQTFSHDVLNNMTEVTSTFTDGSTNHAGFVYMEHNPVQLKSVTNSHADYPPYVEFQYDAEGNMLNDEKLRGYHYNAYGQLETITDTGQTLSDYHYDSAGNIISQIVEGVNTNFYYQGDRLKNEYCGGAHSSYTDSGDSRLYHGVSSNSHQFMVSNAQGSVVNTLTPSGITEEEERTYTPYGEG